METVHKEYNQNSIPNQNQLLIYRLNNRTLCELVLNRKIVFIQHRLFFYFMLKWILPGDEEAGHAAAHRLVFLGFFFLER